MNDQIADLRRRIDNLLRLGTITEVRGSACRVKTGDITTAWRPWFTTRAGTARTSWRPTVGEQVMLLSLSGDLANAYVLPAIYQFDMPEPDNHPERDRTVYPDGAIIEYDPEASALKVTGIKTALVQATEQVTIDCPETLCTGNMTIKGTLTNNGINLTTHTHQGDSGGTTGGPK